VLGFVFSLKLRRPFGKVDWYLVPSPSPHPNAQFIVHTSVVLFQLLKRERERERETLVRAKEQGVLKIIVCPRQADSRPRLSSQGD
jgi:hypothetical protein